MGLKGDFLELIDEAPSGAHTFQASLRRWKHHERSHRAFRELVRPHLPKGAAVFVAVGADMHEEISDGHLRVWIDLPNRWRIEGDDRIDVSNGTTHWQGRPDRLTLLDADTPEISMTGLAPLIEPGRHILGMWSFANPVVDEAAGRRCLRADGRSMPLRGRQSQALGLGGIDHTLWVDAETGIVLRHVGRIDDEPCAIDEFRDVIINELIGANMFRYVPPKSAVVLRQVDHLIRLAERRGVDLSTVDQSDPEAVRRAITEGRHRVGPPPEKVKTMRRAKHVPVGPPPTDVIEARRQIEYAYSRIDEVGPDASTLVNVQSGEGLAELLAQARQRAPVPTSRATKPLVDDVLFLRSDEAVVWFGVEIDGNRVGVIDGREGRAVLVDGVWKVEHATVVSLLSLAGVTYPPKES